MPVLKKLLLHLAHIYDLAFQLNVDRRRTVVRDFQQIEFLAYLRYGVAVGKSI